MYVFKIYVYLKVWEYIKEYFEFITISEKKGAENYGKWYFKI